MKYILIGKIVNTHGLKGEIRILSSFKYKNKVFIPNMKVYIGKEKTEEVINTDRHHKIFEMITLKNYNYIDEVLKYKGEYIFVNKEDIKLSDNEYLNEDIIGLNVYLEDKLLGVVNKIENHNGNEVLYVNGVKHYIIPYNFDIILSVDLKEKRMQVRDIPGLF